MSSIELLPAGQLSLLWPMGIILTNVKLESLQLGQRHPIWTPTVVNTEVAEDDFARVILGEDSSWYKTIDLINGIFENGKYVCMKNRAFFLAPAEHGMVHADMPRLIDINDPVAVLGAGFISIHANRVRTRGVSISLRMGPRIFDNLDGIWIGKHFGIHGEEDY